MIKKVLSLNPQHLKGLLTVRGDYRFLDQSDLITLFINLFYQKKSVVVIYDSKKAFDSIPKLNIKKRDDFTTYMLGMTHDMVFVEFELPTLASDWAFSIPLKSGIRWEIYSNGVLIRNEKGVVKPPKSEEKGDPYDDE
jgi:hypothetical protein